MQHRARSLALAILAFWAILSLGLPARTLAQTENPSPPSSPAPPEPAAKPPQAEDRDVTLKGFAGNFFSDQKLIWTFPAKLAKPSRLVPTLLVSGATAGLVTADPPVARMVRRNAGSFDGLNRVFSENYTTAATLLTPAAFYVTGLVTHDDYVKKTGLLAAEAWVSADITALAFRSTTRRTRPLDVPPTGDFTGTWFQTGANPTKSAGSFPSGHAAWEFAVATVIARRHGAKHKWVPWVAYGLATAAGLSRITSRNHYASDVFFGAGLGYVVGRYVVLRQ